ncbi:MAG: hypothetical protein V3V85_02465, partial [Candidatus Thorarchaeota archaeon]
MIEKPILFSTDMVRRILTCAKCGHISRPFPCEKCGSTEFCKTQTRRCHVKPQPPEGTDIMRKLPDGRWLAEGKERTQCGLTYRSPTGSLAWKLPY